MVRELIGVALISVGTLTMIVRVMARSLEFQHRSLRNTASQPETPRGR
jgi:hypothetical protein